MSELLDVVVIGAGLSGLSTAKQLLKKGASVAVLEARDRVGGRTLSRKVGNGIFDLGGQWIGPSQHRVMALSEELEIETFPTYHQGKKVLSSLGKISSYQSTIPSLPLLSLLELEWKMRKLDSLRKQVPLFAPQDAKHAHDWDNISLEAWKRKIFSKRTRGMFDSAVRAIFGAEPSELSLLFFLFYLNSGGGLLPLIEIENGAQQERFVEGAQSLSKKLAEHLGDRVHLEQAVQTVEQNEEEVNIQTKNSSYRARYVVFAIAPTLIARIEFMPSLPAKRDQLMQRMPMGSMIKCLVTYEDHFWRAQGFSGEAVSDDGPVCVVFDNTSHDGRQPALLGFISGKTARQWGAESKELRKAAVLQAFAKFFGPKALEPTDYVEQNWADEPYTRGCPVGLLPPGAMRPSVESLREPIGRIYWAGTETAIEWNGYLEGALESAERVVQELVKIL